jgi:hypothetical protein
MERFVTEEYDDDYGTCKATSASFRVIHRDLNPADVTLLLGMQPTWAYKRGDSRGERETSAPRGIWGFSTEDMVVSRDLRRHLDMLVDQLYDKVEQLNELRSRGYQLDVFCDWIRSGGTGGPTLSPRNMAGLSRLGLKIGFEFWSVDEDNDDETQE